MIYERRLFDLGYLSVAEPLTFEHIHDDIEKLALDDREPRKIILWHHQWDWLVKSLQPLRHDPAPIRNVLFGDSLMEIQARAYSKDEPPTIYGVPVEIRG